MCWNAEVSIATFIAGFASAIILLIMNKTPYHYILIGLSITSMQLLEFFAWRNINNEKFIENLSVLGLFIIMFQLFIINYSIYNKRIRNIALAFLGTYLIAFIIIILPTLKFDIEKGNNGHLIWHWIDMDIQWQIIVYMFYLIPFYLNKDFVILYLGIISLIFSLYFYYKYKTFGTIWCHISNLFWLILLLNAFNVRA
jgi:hypothetical protein